MRSSLISLIARVLPSITLTFATQNKSMTSYPVFRNCPLCGGNDARPHFQKSDLRVVCCRCCSMVYANPVSDEFASGDYYHRIGADYYLDPAKLESDYADVRF